MQRYTSEIKGNLVQLGGDLTMYTITKDWWSMQNTDHLASFDKQAAIVFDLQELTRTDSAGLAWLINIVRDSQQSGYQIQFKNIPEELNNLAKISDASTLLPLQ